MTILLSRFGTNNADADLDNSGVVNALDLTILLANFGSGSTGGGTTPVPTSPPTGGSVAEEQNGRVRVEAESFTRQTNDSVRKWYRTSANETPGITPDGDESHASSASGGAYIEILPDTRRSSSDQLQAGVNFDDDPGDGALAVIEYPIKFNAPGRYYVWVRAYSTGSEDNGVHVGLNNTWPESGKRMQWCAGKDSWYWDSKQRTGSNHCGEEQLIYLDIPTAGVHTVMFAMREDGFEFDAFELNKEYARP